jgi:hypothetical protein
MTHYSAQLGVLTKIGDLCLRAKYHNVRLFWRDPFEAGDPTAIPYPFLGLEEYEFAISEMLAVLEYCEVITVYIGVAPVGEVPQSVEECAAYIEAKVYSDAPQAHFEVFGTYSLARSFLNSAIRKSQGTGV